MRESKEEPEVKDESLPSAPHLLYPDIPCDSATIDFPCENSFLDVSTSDHSKDTSDVSLSLHCGEDTSSSEIFSNLSFFISETQRVNFLTSHLPLCTIHKIMRMMKNIPNFLILVVMISLLLHPIMMLIQSLLICLRHWSMMIYLSTKLKPPRLSRHFSPS